VTGSTTERGGSVHSLVKYDILGKIAENTELTRKTTAEILTGIQASVFGTSRRTPSTLSPKHRGSSPSRRPQW
jgi:type III restriction enzyme